MHNILIHGSCVSRDTLEFFAPDKFNLVRYHARSSLASLSNIKNNCIRTYSSNLSSIESNFQRRMVEYDFSHAILHSVKNLEFDILLIDLIDERFHLAILDDDSLVTRSSEFLKSKIKPKELIDSKSNAFFDLWCEGVDFLFNYLSELNLIDKVRIQKTYWASNVDNGNLIENISSDLIVHQNKILKKMYNYLEKYIKDSQFITIPDELILAKANHKWGVSPFHFIDEYYMHVIKALKLE